MNQELYTSKQLAEQLKQKGYDNMYQFYSSGFDFRDKLEAGLKQVEKELASKTAENDFKLSSYPVWSGEDEAHIHSYMRCSFHHGQFSIDELELTYKNGLLKFDEQVLRHPTMEQIPYRSELRQHLAMLTNPPKLKHKGIKR